MMFGLCRNCCEECTTWYRCHVCCKCVPNWVCVTVSAGDACSFISKRSMFTLDTDEDNPTYSGAVACGALSVDLTFTFEDDNGTCKLFLASTCLGLTGLSRLSSTIAIGHCLMEGDEITFTVVDAAGCGDDTCGDLTITIAPLEIVPSPLPCCSCLPRCLCVHVILADESGDGELCWDGESEGWEGTVDVCGTTVSVRVEISDDGVGECEISATVSYGGNDYNIGPTTLADGTCTALGLLVLDDDFLIDPMSYDNILCIRSKTCRCDRWPCGDAPCTLSVSIVNECSNISFDLILEARSCFEENWIWSGTSAENLECIIESPYPTCTSLGPVTVTLRVSNNDGCITALLTITAGSCTFETDELDISCNPVLIEKTGSFVCECTDELQITITE